MSLYYVIIYIVKGLLYLINGRPYIIGRENIPDYPCILAGTHRSWLDPIYMVLLGLPDEVAMMGKQSLFKNPIVSWLVRKVHAFPVNREKPSSSTMRHAVSVIQDKGYHLGIFPTGTRYSTEIKSGTGFIQRLTKTDIIPISIQPPMNFWEIATRKKAKIAIGKPIPYDPSIKYNKEDLKLIDEQIAHRFQELDELLDPSYRYEPPQKLQS